ncbi:MAG TPA: sigma-70 family RNA polymerase sigma factor, partial [Polyangiaceae bacterium]|nr:sigma-70 family RNA polymerase sigma factor [Polyangiaceae bacterium]
SLLAPSLPELPTRMVSSNSDRNQRLTSAVSLHFDSVWRMLRRMGVPAADVDDAAQRVFLALDKRLADVPVERERGFLLSAAVRIAANTRRHLKRSREDAVLDDESVAHEPSPERALEHRQQLAELDQALSNLSHEQRTVFVLYEIEGFSLPEIARSLAVPIGTATSRLRRARETFESWLAARRARGEDS